MKHSKTPVLLINVAIMYSKIKCSDRRKFSTLKKIWYVFIEFYSKTIFVLKIY